MKKDTETGANGKRLIKIYRLCHKTKRRVLCSRACFILHNLCQMGGDLGEWLGLEELQELVHAAAAERQGHGGAEGQRQPAVERRAGVELRNMIVHRFA